MVSSLDISSNIFILLELAYVYMLFLTGRPTRYFQSTYYLVDLVVTGTSGVG